MTLGCITHPIIPGRREPSDKSEMITQLLFGETYEVLEAQKKWVLVKNSADGYECWIDRKQHMDVSGKPDLPNIINSVFDKIKTQQGSLVLPAGSKIGQGDFSIGQKKFNFRGGQEPSKTEVTETADQFLGAPYLWGGKSILGIDCSGFVQVVYSCCGIQLPRDAHQQAEVGKTVDFVETALPGDLAYFDNEEGRITHVGIMLNGEEIIHASGSVRVDKIDHEGIFNAETQSYTHSLRIVKRIGQK